MCIGSCAQSLDCIFCWDGGSSFLLILHDYQITKLWKLAGKSHTIWLTILKLEADPGGGT